MRRWGRLARQLLLLAAATFWTAGSVALAQDSSTSSPPTAVTSGNQRTERGGGLEVSDVIFPWAQEGFAKGWVEGLVRFGLGFAGALVTAYLFLGDFLPSMGGKVEYELQKEELEDLKKRQKKTMDLLEKFVAGEDQVNERRVAAGDRLNKDFDVAIARGEAAVSKERWRLFWIGFPIYILLGGFFASAFATNKLQALLIGFGWTAIADRIGLQRELEHRKSLKDQKIEELETQTLRYKDQLDVANTRIAELQSSLEVKHEAARLLKSAPVADAGGAPPPNSKDLTS